VTTVRKKQLEHSNPQEALADLCEGLIEDRSWVSSCEAVEADDIPQPARGLLVHHQHMTATLKAHYGQDVELNVLADCLEGDHYARKILLTLPGQSDVVEFGIARLDLRFTDEEVRSAILGRAAPLGAILIEHRVLTKVTPKWYLRFRADCSVMTFFGQPPVEAFGRLATIHCNGDAAVELLEVVPRNSRFKR
jgi:hypothetical protein